MSQYPTEDDPNITLPIPRADGAATDEQISAMRDWFTSPKCPEHFVLARNEILPLLTRIDADRAKIAQLRDCLLAYDVLTFEATPFSDDAAPTANQELHAARERARRVLRETALGTLPVPPSPEAASELQQRYNTMPDAPWFKDAYDGRSHGDGVASPGKGDVEGLALLRHVVDCHDRVGCTECAHVWQSWGTGVDAVAYVLKAYDALRAQLAAMVGPQSETQRTVTRLAETTKERNRLAKHCAESDRLLLEVTEERNAVRKLAAHCVPFIENLRALTFPNDPEIVGLLHEIAEATK